MASKKISALDAAASATTTMEVPVNDSGTNKRVTLEKIRDLFGAAVLTSIEVEVSSAEIQAMFVTPKVLIPGVAGKIISFVRGSYAFDVGNIQYVGGGTTIQIKCGGAVIVSSVLVASQLNGSVDLYGSFAGGVGPNVGQDIVLTNNTAPHTTGNGTLRIKLLYHLMDANP